jgi:rhodanese-related sulfurtransferase
VRNLAGVLAGGMTNWRQERHPASHTERLRAQELPARLSADPEMQVLDVREHSEWAAGHLPGSSCTPWHDIVEIPAGLDPGLPIAVICGAGLRAATAASLLRHHGAEQVIHVVDGGVPALGRLGHQLLSG